MTTGTHISFSRYGALLSRYLRPQRWLVAGLAVLLLGGIGLQLQGPQLLRSFIDLAVQQAPMADLTRLALLFLGVALVSQVVSVAVAYLSESVGWTATNALRADLAEHCLGLDMAFHKARTPGELIERIDGDVNELSNFFAQFVINMLGNALLLVGVLALLFREDWRVGLGLTAFAVFALVVLVRIRSIATPFWNAVRDQSALFYGFVGEQLAGTEDVRASGATSYVMRRFYTILRGWLPVTRRANYAGYSMWWTTMAMFALGNAIAFSLGAFLWGRGEITIGTVYLIFHYTELLRRPIEELRTQLEDLQRADASIGRVGGLFATEPSIRDGRGTPIPAGPLEVGFEQVSFSYDDAEAGTKVLSNISFTLAPGRVLGLLGRTGSGKTTLARLLVRLYDPREGQIRLGGTPLPEALVADVRARVGIVTQDVQLFNASLRDNLSLFDRAIPDERLLAALRELGLEPWYESLPNGLETELAAGGGLSAGEAQLLAFARLFLADPGLIILDEASSRLDPATEQLIERAVGKLLANRTGIIIAHRLATVQRADEIMILERGQILEHGERTALAANEHSRFAQLLQMGMEEVLV